MIEGVEKDTAKDQFLRADHLFYVTLKYTRTADVIKNIITRLVSILELVMIEKLKKKRIRNIPENINERVMLLEKKHPRDKSIKELVELHSLLKKIDQTEYTAKEEYRKNVALVTPFIEVNMVKLKEFFEATKKYVEEVS